MKRHPLVSRGNDSEVNMITYTAAIRVWVLRLYPGRWRLWVFTPQKRGFENHTSREMNGFPLFTHVRVLEVIPTTLIVLVILIIRRY